MADTLKDGFGLEGSSLWINRVCTLGSEASGRSCRELLSEWNVHGHLIDTLESHNITNLLPVQEKVIPILLSGSSLDRYSAASSDIVITAPTGQGKTLCYMLPIVNNIIKHKFVGIRALIIAPTRELVHQIYDFCNWFLDSDPAKYDLRGGELLKVYSCHGNTPFITDHMFLLENQPQIVVFTPGRFMEHFSHRQTSFEKKLNFSTLKWIVVDEVDLLLSQSFYNWTAAVATICKECQALDAKNAMNTFSFRRPQKICEFGKSSSAEQHVAVVSATIPTKSSEIDLLQLHRPLLLKSGETLFSLPENLSQKYITTTNTRKAFSLILLVNHLLQSSKSGEKVIVFCSFKETTHKTARLLEIFFQHIKKKFRILELSSRFSQKQREDIIQQFQSDQPMCLVCSDIGARGINFPNARSIINYDFPKSITKYIHRIGRTARANEAGTSYIIVSGQTESRFNQFLEELNVKEGEVEQLVLSKLAEPKKEAGLYASYESIKKLVDHCLELENSGNIAHDAPLPPNWNTMFEVAEKEES